MTPGQKLAIGLIAAIAMFLGLAAIAIAAFATFRWYYLPATASGLG